MRDVADLSTTSVVPTDTENGDDLKSIGRYRVLGIIKSGGQGTLYRAWHPSLEIEVAIKIARAFPWPESMMPPNEGTSPVPAGEMFHERLKAEGRRLAALIHPGIARIYDLDIDADRPFLVLELIRGRNLAEWARENPLSPQQIVCCITKISQAMEASHQCGILHLDIKPENILIDELNEPRLVDFGMSRAVVRANAVEDTLVLIVPTPRLP